MAAEETYFRDQMEKALKEAKLHKQRVEQLEKENLALKKSVYDLSARLSIAMSGGRAGGSMGRKPFPHFAIETQEEVMCFPAAVASITVDGSLSVPTAAAAVSSNNNASTFSSNNGNSTIHPPALAVDSPAVSSLTNGGAPIAASALPPHMIDAVVGQMGNYSTAQSIQSPSSTTATTPRERDQQQRQPLSQQSSLGGQAIGSARPTSAPSPDFEQSSLIPSTSTNSYQSSVKSKYFHFKYDLKGHTGAVYCAQFSPCGKYLASGSFDKTARVWDVMTTQSELLCFRSHSLNISDLCWSHDSAELLTGAYDNTCRTWDVETGAQSASYDTEGFVQCVGYNPQNSNYLFYGTSRKVLSLIDKRRPESSLIIRNDAMVNAMYVYNTGTMVLTGDSTGCLKTWDIRFANQCVQCTINEPARKPISHITTCRQNPDEEEPRYLAVNSYDNIIRVYDRGLDPPKTSLRLLHALAGHKNKNWPIKSSFYQGPLVPQLKRSQSQEHGIYGHDAIVEVHESPQSYRKDNPWDNRMLLLATGSADPFAFVYSMSAWPATSPASSATQSASNAAVAVSSAIDPFINQTTAVHPLSSTGTAFDQSIQSQSLPPPSPISADTPSISYSNNNGSGNQMMFPQPSLQSPQVQQPQVIHMNHHQVAYEIVQKLEGHSDRVYCTAFHPHDILLASCSADSTIKIWKGRSISQYT